MISRVRASQSVLSVGKARMGTLVATEEFPFKDILSPKAAAPAVIKSIKLKSGIQAISRDYNSSIVSLNFAVIGGSRAESADQKGAAHFLSSAAYAGNSTNSGLRLVRYLESFGASFGSYADKEKIVYHVKVLPDKVEPVIGAILSAIATPPHAVYVLEESKAAAQLDYNYFAANAGAQLQELVHEAAFGEASPLGRSLFAPSLKKLSVPEVLCFRAAQFTRSNLVVTANGIAQDRLQAILDPQSDRIPAGTTTALPASLYVGGDSRVRTDMDGVSHLALAFPVPAGEAGKPYMVLKALLNSKIGSGGKKVSASAFLSTFSGSGGLLGVNVAGSAASATAQLDGLVAELKAIANKCPDISVLKQKVTLDNFLALEGENTANALLDAHLHGLDLASAGDVRAVTPASVSAAAAAALSSVPTYAVLGATAGTPSYATISKLVRL